MSLGRADIERRVPQSGAMCLLNGVLEWDETSISCTAMAPHEAHPLARDGVVPSVAAVEYAAQATAMHGSLIEESTGSRPGVLAKLTDVALHLACIPQDGGPLHVRAQRIGHSDRGCLYNFSVVSRHGPIASGRLLVAFTPLPAS